MHEIIPEICLHVFFCYSAGIVLEEKNFPPFFPIIHHDIPKDIPVHLQRMQYMAFASFLGTLFLFVEKISSRLFYYSQFFLLIWNLKIWI